MRKNYLAAIIIVGIILVFLSGMPNLIIASEFNFKSFEDLGKELDKLGDLFDNFDINNLPTEDNTSGKVNTNDNTEIKTGIMIAASNTYTLGLQSNGRVISTGFSLTGANKVSDWSSITMIAAGFEHSVGLKSDGRVVATGTNTDGQCKVAGWQDITSVAAGYTYTIGLKKDGTVIGTGSNSDEQLDVASWKDIIAIAAGASHSVGLKSDGTVLSVGKDCGTILNTSGWRDIVSISASATDIMGVDKNGKVYSTFANKNVSKFTDVIGIATAELYAAGLKKDGTVVTTAEDINVSDWKNITSIVAGTTHIVGLKSDGTVVAADLEEGAWKLGQTNVSSWQLNVNTEKVITEKINIEQVITVLPTAAKVLVNNKEAAFEAYNIEGNNYFKLRDLAYVLNGTEKQFEVTWDGEKNAINLLSKKAYTHVGGEMVKGNQQVKNATASTAKIYVDGKQTPLKAYTIKGNNFFKLRDIMQVFDIYVGWDGVNQIITLDTAKNM